jgi:hypothetical protein
MKSNSCICPICGKPIQDYHSQDVICPACNTDLSIYRTISDIPENKSWKGWLYMAIVAVVATIAVAIIFFVSSSKNSDRIEQLEAEKSELIVSNIQLTDSINVMSTKEETIQAYPYVIRRGDSFWSISLKFFGTGTHAKQIAIDNNVTLESTLVIGDTLLIKY